MDIQRRNEQMEKESIEFRISHNKMKDQINDLREKLHKENSEKALLQKFNQKLNQDVEKYIYHFNVVFVRFEYIYF